MGPLCAGNCPECPCVKTTLVWSGRWWPVATLSKLINYFVFSSWQLKRTQTGPRKCMLIPTEHLDIILLTGHLDIILLTGTSRNNIAHRTSRYNIAHRTSRNNIAHRTSRYNIAHRTSRYNIVHRNI